MPWDVLWRSFQAIALAVVINCVFADPALAASPVVSIWVESADRTEAGIGTGFMIDKDGRILTCYHVIRGATHLTIYQDKTAYKDVQVVAVAPDYDLAALQIANYPAPGPFLPLSNAAPSQFFGEELKVLGNPNGLSASQLDAKTTRDTYQPSGEFRTLDGRGDPIFRSSSVNLLPLQMIAVYKGLSGSPVVSKAGVVGILSGSFNEGGAIAWAIPVMYASESQMSPIHRKLAEITSWPDLSMMRSSASWNTLRFKVSISAGVSLAIDSYISGVDEFTVEAQDLLVKQFGELGQAVGQLIDSLDAVRASRRYSPEDKATVEEIDQRIKAIRQGVPSRLKSLSDRQTTLSNRLSTLISEVNTYYQLLPDSPPNRQRIAKAKAGFQIVSVNLARGGLQLMTIGEDVERKFQALNFDKARSLGAIRKSLVKEKQIIDDAAKGATSSFATIATSYRQLGDVAESLLNEQNDEQDQKSLPPPTR